MCLICNNDNIDSNKSIVINNCVKLTYNIFINYKDLNRISNLYINNCPNLNMIPIIDKLYSLTISNCSNITFILINTKLKYLTVLNCYNLNNIPITDSIKILKIINCPQLKNNYELSNFEQLSLID